MTQPSGTQAVPVSMIYVTLLVYAKAVWKKLPTYLSYCNAVTREAVCAKPLFDPVA